MSQSEKSHNGQDMNEQEVTGRMPDFMIIGAMKSGTTSLYHLLKGHPQIFLPRWKEPQYFSREHMYSRGEQFYRDIFKDATEEQLIGEASTCYSRWPYYPEAAERIGKRLPDLRLIYIMRHPVDRAYSHYGHIMQERMLKESGPLVSFEEALEQEREIIDTSLYMMQIKKYLEVYKREQILCLVFDDLKNDPDKLLEEIQRFLGVESLALNKTQNVKANKWGDKLGKSRVWKLVGFIENIKALKAVAQMIPKKQRRQLRWALVHSNGLASFLNFGVKEKKKELSPLTPEIREKLLKRFEEPTTELEEFLGRRIESWHV